MTDFTIQLDENWKFYDRNSVKLKVRDVGIFMVEFVITRERMITKKKRKYRIPSIHFKISNISTIIQQQQCMEGSIYFHTLNFSQCIIFIVKAI